MVILLTAIILSGIANRFAPNYPTFLVGLTFHSILYQEYGRMEEVSEDINTITLFLGVFLCAFMSLAYGTVMYVWMMEHCDGELFSSTLQFLFLNVFLLQVKSRLCLEPVLTTTLDFGA